MSLILDPLRRLKWGFLPVERHVKDPEIDDDVSLPEIIAETNNIENGKEKEGDETFDILDSNSETSVQLEYRNIIDRKWYSFFDEYEYRQSKKVISSHKWYHWFNENDTPAERKLILKLDILLCLYSMMAYWVKYLDQANLNNAYVSGMKESLGMKGNDLVHTQAVFTVGTIVFQIPFMYVLYRAPMNYILPALDFCWSCFTIGTYRIDNVQHLQAIRFFVGAFESPCYLAYQYLSGSWYKVDEITRRSMIYYIGQYLGVLTSGLLQASIYNSLNGTNGLEGWRWMFIIDAIILFAVGAIGFFVIPGTPQKCYSIFLTDEEILLARKRLKNNGTSFATDFGFFEKKMWKKVLTSWHFYVLSLWNIFCWNNNNGTSGAYLLWLKSLKRYSTTRVNQLSAVTPAVGILWLILVGCYADLFHSRWQAILWTQAFNITGNVILAVWDVEENAKWFAFMLQYTGWAMAPVLYSWINDMCRDDPQYRAIILILMFIPGQTKQAWVSVLVLKTVEAPRYLKGFTFTACSAFSLAVWTFVVLYYYKREEKRKAAAKGIILMNEESKIPENVSESVASNLETISLGK